MEDNFEVKGIYERYCQGKSWCRAVPSSISAVAEKVVEFGIVED